MVLQAQLQDPVMSVEDFDEWTLLPENEDKLLEWIAGEVYEVPSNPFASYIAMRILRPLGNFVDENKLGYVTGEQGGYMVSGERYAPDVAYISFARQPELALSGYNPNPPDFAVEVDFPSTLASARKLRSKIAAYMAAGTLLWVVYPENKDVEVYTPGQPMKRVGLNGVLDGGAVLPGFTLPVKVIFGE